MIGNTQIALIVALANNNAIGKDGNLLLHLSEDLKWFKRNTLAHSVIMGRKTFESLPNGALPNRKNIVLTRNENFEATNCIIVNNIEEIEQYIGNEQICFVIGGAEIYQQFLSKADILYITRIYADFVADTFFPEIDFSKWELTQKIENKADKKNNIDFDFLIYQKNKK